MARKQQNAPKTAQINDRLLSILPGETVLEAALRQGIDFPNSCRVGGCATCKCRLVEGAVKERTETSYLLSAEELDEGYILACQSVPKGHVRIEVDLAEGAAPPALVGKVVAQTHVTHDITRLTVQLEHPLAYRAGQFANLSMDALPGVVRSYSFATPARPDSKVSFYIRKVPGGQLSTLVNDGDVLGATVRMAAPHGDFWLRDSRDAPIVMVAGGSGLPPMLAMLEEALAAGVARDVTLLFGAREQRDLYALAEIERLAQRWQGEFRFVPVLSAADDDAAWTGERGMVTDKLADLLRAGSHAYLCGPAAMVDGAVDVLLAHGVPRQHIHFDRFTTLSDAALARDVALPPTVVEKPSLLGALHYLKYFSFHAIGLFAAAAILAGGKFITASLALVLTLYMLGDALAGDDTSTPTFRYPGILTAQLWLALPLLALIVFASVWSVCSGDPLGFGALLSSLSGYDVIMARDATTFGHHISAWLLTGLMIGMVGTIPAHELTHRTWDPVSMFVGRWLLAFSFDTTFAIEHVYGHHRYVSTREDPATAPRGRNVYAHVLASTVRGNLSAWKIEAQRLAKKRRGPLSLHNAFLRGHVLSVGLCVAAYALGGTSALLYFTACALWGKALLEIVNYMEHYGMVRDPATPVQPRHSWNTNRRVSSWTMFNLTRHSHHHAQGEVPYQDLRPYPEAPMMIGGYLTTIVVALVPPLWHHLMTPRVLAWDRDFASAEEKRLAREANARSGNRVMQQASDGGAVDAISVR
jgi:NAD(P)H-flavin reductase/ferredoxin/fatty-acid desaturase